MISSQGFDELAGKLGDSRRVLFFGCFNTFREVVRNIRCDCKFRGVVLWDSLSEVFDVVAGLDSLSEWDVALAKSVFDFPFDVLVVDDVLYLVFRDDGVYNVVVVDDLRTVDFVSDFIFDSLGKGVSFISDGKLSRDVYSLVKENYSLDLAKGLCQLVRKFMDGSHVDYFIMERFREMFGYAWEWAEINLKRSQIEFYRWVLHTINHVRNVLYNTRLLMGDRICEFNDLERFVLFTSVLFHDVIMMYDVEIVRNFVGKYRKILNSILENLFKGLDSIPTRWGGRERSSTIIRKYHALLSGFFFSKNLAGEFDIDADCADMISRVIYAHSSKFDLKKLFPSRVIVDGVEFEVRLDLLGAILRLADSMDISRTRLVEMGKDPVDTFVERKIWLWEDQVLHWVFKLEVDSVGFSDGYVVVKPRFPLMAIDDHLYGIIVFDVRMILKDLYTVEDILSRYGFVVKGVRVEGEGYCYELGRKFLNECMGYESVILRFCRGVASEAMQYFLRDREVSVKYEYEVRPEDRRVVRSIVDKYRKNA